MLFQSKSGRDQHGEVLGIMLEQLIQAATKKITKDRTSIVIAHRLATIQKADVIIVLDAGEIIEMGTHSSLLKNKEGAYSGLYKAQFLKQEH
jgi:subfamily B ATP-binding cassette protein MsbA